jgi:putative oxidoreductase
VLAARPRDLPELNDDNGDTALVAGLAVIVSGVMQITGGLSVVLGLLPILGLLLLIIFLIPTSLLMHNFWTIQEPQQRAAEQVKFLKNLALVGAALALMYGASYWPLSIG